MDTVSRDQDRVLDIQYPHHPLTSVTADAREANLGWH